MRRQKNKFDYPVSAQKKRMSFPKYTEKRQINERSYKV